MQHDIFDLLLCAESGSLLRATYFCDTLYTALEPIHNYQCMIKMSCLNPNKKSCCNKKRVLIGNKTVEL